MPIRLRYALFSRKNSPSDDPRVLVCPARDSDLPAAVGLLRRERNRAHRLLARRHVAARETRQQPCRHRQPAAARTRTADRRAPSGQQRGEHRGVVARDRRAARVVRRGGRDLRHRRDDHGGRRLLRGAAEDRGDQFARPRFARDRRADLLAGAAARSGADGDRSAGPLDPPQSRHSHRRRPADTLCSRAAARDGRSAAPRGRRRETGPGHARRIARPAGPGGLGRDDPSHRDDHAQRRRPADGNLAGGARRTGDAHPAVAQQPGEHRRRAARQGPVARHSGGGWRRGQSRRDGDRARALVRARHHTAGRAAQGVPTPQDAVRARGR